MANQLIINHTYSETRIAEIDEESLVRISIERHRNYGILGNIYYAKVSRVLPGIQAAFVNIGTAKAAFLYGGDIVDPENVTNEEEVNIKEALTPEELKDSQPHIAKPIQEILKDGDTICVQVSKEALGTKGARITTFLSIAGRYLVYMPYSRRIAVSKQITDEKEKTRLVDIVSQIKEKNYGLIIRTAANGVGSGELQKDLKNLHKIWRTIDAKRKTARAPSLLYGELSLIYRTIRDVYNEHIEKIIIDDKEFFEKTKNFLIKNIPKAISKLELYEEKMPIFDVYGVEMDIAQALNIRVDLRSGGYLIIDQTEALISVDVNTGRFVGQLSARDTILKTNVEAVKAIAKQLQARNIGGIIIIDFIDMEELEDREHIYNLLQEELLEDRARTNVLEVSELGLIQMTRKRTSQSLERLLLEPCPTCNTKGRIRSTETEAYDLMRELRRFHIQTGEKVIKVKIRKDVHDLILNQEKDMFRKVLKSSKIKVEFQKIEFEQFDKKVLAEAAFEVLYKE